MVKDIAVIGAGGFIGRHLCNRLNRLPASLHLYGKSSRTNAPTEIKPVDFEDVSSLKKIANSVDVLYYLASETIPSSSWDFPLSDIQKNLVPFVRFLEASVNSRLRKIIFVSSAGTVYGTTAGKVNEDAVKKPFSPYGIVKLTMEHFLEYFRSRCGVHYDIFRVSNVYGSGQNTSKGLGIINTFLENIVENRELTVFGDGLAMRNYIFVEDVAEILARSSMSPDESGIYNLASDSALSINALIEVIREVVKEPVSVNYRPGRKSDNSFIDLDNTRLKQKYTDFRVTDIKKGIRLTYESIAEKHKS